MANNVDTLAQAATYAGSNTLSTSSGGSTTTATAPPTGGQLWPRGNKQ